MNNVGIAAIAFVLGLAAMYAWNFRTNAQVAASFQRQQGAIDVMQILCPKTLEPFQAKDQAQAGARGR